MDKGAMVTEQVNASVRFLREFENFSRVVAAFWLKENGKSDARFYLAPRQLGPDNRVAATREILRIATDMNDPHLSPFRVSLVGRGEPTVKAALDHYKGHAPGIPIHLGPGNFGGVDVDEVYLIKGSSGEFTMASGRQVLDQIIDREAEFFEQHGAPPRKMKLPVLMAYDLSKCGREELGDLSGRVFKDGIGVFEKEGLHGMKVEIVRDRNAALQFE
jgi:hypothetical protein